MADLLEPGFEEIRRRTLQGDEEGWRLFVERFSRFVHGAARHLARAGSDRDEVAQEVYLAVFEKIAKDDFRLLRAFRGDARFETYLFVVIRNEVAHLRRLTVREGMPTVPLDEETASAAGAHRAADDFAASIGLRPERVAAIVSEALEQLEPRERLVLRLRFGEGASLRLLARMFGWKDTNEAAYEVCKIVRKLRLLDRCRKTLGWGEPEREVLLEALRRWLAPPLHERSPDHEL